MSKIHSVIYFVAFGSVGREDGRSSDVCLDETGSRPGRPLVEIGVCRGRTEGVVEFDCGPVWEHGACTRPEVSCGSDVVKGRPDRCFTSAGFRFTFTFPETSF